MRRRLLIEIAAVIVLCMCFAVLISKKKHAPVIFQQKVSISKLKVLRADTFDCTLKDKSRLLAKLPVYATDDAKDFVVGIMNHGSSPKIILNEKQKDGCWKVDFFINHNGKEVNLSNLLSEKNLVYK